MKRHLIDSTEQPSIPYDGWTIESHDTSLEKVDVSNLTLYLDKGQKGDSYIEGDKLRERLKNKPVLNATVLDYLWEHQDLIPESWKEKTKGGYTKYIYFWGTLYRSSLDLLYVRCLCWGGEAWIRSCGWLDDYWSSRDPAALASSFAPEKLSPRSLDSLNLGKRVKELEKFKAKVEGVLKI